jgi:hypothetical protein
MPGIASVFLAPLQGLITTFQTERHYKNAKTDEALLAIKKSTFRIKKAH